MPMHAATSIVHGIFILLLGKVLLAQGGRHGMLVIAADRRQLHSAAFRFFVMMV
jgi:hypothetical protein